MVSANDVIEHFAFPGNIAFAADDQGAFHVLPNFIPRGRLALPDFPGLFKFRIQYGFHNRVKQRSLRAVESILRARLLQKVNIPQQRTVVLLPRRTSIKNLEKRKIRSETFATWKYWKYRIPELFDKTI